MSIQSPLSGVQPEARGERAAGDTATGLGDAQTEGQGPKGQQRPQPEAIAQFEAALTAAVPLASAPPPMPELEEPEALPIAPPVTPLVVVQPGQPVQAPALPASRAAEVAEMVNKVNAEIRSATTAQPTLMSEGFVLRLEMGRSMLGVQAMTLNFGPGTIVLSLTMAPSGAAHDMPLAVQALAAALSARHPTRTIRIDEEERSSATDTADDSPFNPLTTPIARS